MTNDDDKTNVGEKDGSIKITTGDGIDTIKINNANTTPLDTNQNNTLASTTGLSYDVTITDFAVGTAGDKIDFLTNPTLTGYDEIDVGTAGSAVDAKNGLNVIYSSDVQADSLKISDMVTFLNNEVTAKESAATYFVLTDGSDAAVIRVENDGTAKIAEKEVSVLVTLSGISNTKDLHVDNFTDFLA